MDYKRAAVDTYLQQLYSISITTSTFSLKKKKLERKNGNKTRTWLVRYWKKTRTWYWSETVDLPSLFTSWNMGLGIAEIDRCYPQYPKSTFYWQMKLLVWEDIRLSWWSYLGPQNRSIPTSKDTKDSYVEKERGKGCIRNAVPRTRKKGLEDVLPSLWLPFPMAEVWFNVFGMKGT